MPVGIRFPSTLPPPDRAGYGDTFEETRTQFPPEVGPPRIRNRMRSAPRWFDVVWTLTDEQYSVFDLWWQETIDGGGREFDIQLLDDFDTLTWFTVTAPIPYEAERLNQQQSWMVKWRVRALSETFGTDRPSGTDELMGIANVGIQQASGQLLVYTPLRGAADIGLVSAKARFSLPPLRGAAEVGLYALPKGRLLGVPLYGIAEIGLESADAYFEDGAGSVQRQWSDYDWFGTIAAQDIRAADFGQTNREWMEM